MSPAPPVAQNLLVAPVPVPAFADDGEIVQVYRNLLRAGVWYSVRSRRTRRVIGYTEALLLTEPTFRASAAGQRRARESGHRNVHAWVEGVPRTDVGNADVVWRPARYNVFVCDTFFDAATGEPVPDAAFVHAGPDGLRYAV